MQQMVLKHESPDIKVTIRYDNCKVPGEMSLKFIHQIEVDACGISKFCYPYDSLGIGYMVRNSCKQVLNGETPADESFFKTISKTFFKNASAWVEFERETL